jgi:hypothetical protein
LRAPIEHGNPVPCFERLVNQVPAKKYGPADDEQTHNGLILGHSRPRFKISHILDMFTIYVCSVDQPWHFLLRK